MKVMIIYNFVGILLHEFFVDVYKCAAIYGSRSNYFDVTAE